MSKLPREINENPRWGICCCFEHDKYKGTITNSKTRKLLDKFLREEPTNSKYKNKFQNNWYVIKFLWNSGNSSTKIADSYTMKDYTTIKLYKESK